MTVFEAGLNQGFGKAMSGQSGELRTGGGAYGFKQGPSGLTDGLCDPRRFESRPRACFLFYSTCVERSRGLGRMNRTVVITVIVVGMM